MTREVKNLSLKEDIDTHISVEQLYKMCDSEIGKERLKKILDAKNGVYDFEHLIKEMYPKGIYLSSLFELIENDWEIVEDALELDEQLEEGIIKDIGSAIKNVAGSVKKAVGDVKSNIKQQEKDLYYKEAQRNYDKKFETKLNSSDTYKLNVYPVGQQDKAQQYEIGGTKDTQYQKNPTLAQLIANSKVHVPSENFDFNIVDKSGNVVFDSSTPQGKRDAEAAPQMA